MRLPYRSMELGAHSRPKTCTSPPFSRKNWASVWQKRSWNRWIMMNQMFYMCCACLLGFSVETESKLYRCPQSIFSGLEKNSYKHSGLTIPGFRHKSWLEWVPSHAETRRPHVAQWFIRSPRCRLVDCRSLICPGCLCFRRSTSHNRRFRWGYHGLHATLR